MLKRFALTFLLCVTCLVVMAGCSKKSIPQFVNPGFETGKLTPWTPYGDPQASVDRGPAHTGEFRLAEQAGDGSVWQDVSGLQAGEEYTISAWVSASDGSAATACIGVFNPTTLMADSSEQWKPGLSWQLVKFSVRLDKGDTLRIHLCRKPGVGTIYWDDAQLTYKQ